jgi:hypothetical protein
VPLSAVKAGEDSYHVYRREQETHFSACRGDLAQPSLEAALKMVDELAAEDNVGHMPGMPDMIGREGFKQFVTMIRTAFPDLRFEADDLLAEGDRISARYHGRATHLGTFKGIPPMGKNRSAWFLHDGR